ncbi:O-antigen ligase family protein [uncultured Microbacterium sp.]|uniref:O-antigen ligase family protein n=1 Tax=uncultured Microbacterium sp. TaxID=191216 RepID=UPI0028D4909F|nr:O-antigen ligase family protein [uncultured Microbacterium sp.]
MASPGIVRLRERAGDWWSGAWRWILLAAGMAVVVFYILESGAVNGTVAALAIAVLVVAAAITRSASMAVPLMMMPLLFVVSRVGLGGSILSVSDVALAAAFGAAVLLGERPYSPPLRRLLLFNLIYQFATLFTVIVNPYAQNTIEWFHAWLLISGALIVGWAVGRAGQARTALLLTIGAAGVLGVGVYCQALLQYAQGDFTAAYPTWPFPLQKNAAGCMLAFAALIVYIRPDWMAWSPRWAMPLFWAFVAGVAMTQSRQALIGLIVAIVVISFRRGGRRSGLVLLAAIPGAWLIVTMVIDQIQSQNQFNSYFTRIDWTREVYALWKLSPVFGHGLRYWYVHEWANFQPPQAELEVAASSGLVGLAGFVVMSVGILVVLWRVDPRFGTLAFAIVLSRLVQGQFDLFWVAAQVSIPFVVAGICLGAQSLDAKRGTAANSIAGAEMTVVGTIARSGPDRVAYH